MIISRMLFDENSFGITQRSLKILRDTLARKIDHLIIVVEVPTNALCCGYFIIDQKGEATWTGDGFRLDRGGEGGAGYKSAEALLSIYGISVFPWEIVNFDDNIYSMGDNNAIERKLQALAQVIVNEFEPGLFRKPSDAPGYYVRH